MNELKKHVIKHELVGSRVTCNPAPTDTDQDVLILVADADAFRQHVYESDYLMDGSFVLDAESPLDGYDRFSSYSKGDINLIVTQDNKFYDRFMAATSVAKRLNLLDKADRIALFQAVLYGNRCE